MLEALLACLPGTGGHRGNPHEEPRERDHGVVSRGLPPSVILLFIRVVADPPNDEVPVRPISASQFLLVEHLSKATCLSLDSESLIVHAHEPFPRLALPVGDDCLTGTEWTLEHAELFVSGVLR